MASSFDGYVAHQDADDERYAGYVERSEEGSYFRTPKPSATSRFFSRVKSAAASAAESLGGAGDAAGSYVDLDGDRRKTTLERVEEEMTIKKPAFPAPPKVDEAESVVPVRSTESYAALDDGEERKAPSAAEKYGAALLKGASDIFKPLAAAHEKKPPKDQPPEMIARLDARPFVDPKDYADAALKLPMPEEPAGVIQARLEAEYFAKHGKAVGGLWSLKARLATLEKELAPARISCAAAEQRAKDSRAKLEAATAKRDDLRLVEARLRAFLHAARELAKEEDDRDEAARVAEAAKEALEATRVRAAVQAEIAAVDERNRLNELREIQRAKDRAEEEAEYLADDDALPVVADDDDEKTTD